MNLDQLLAIGISRENPQIKLGSLCKKLNPDYYLESLRDMYRNLSNLMYNHHLHARFHGSTSLTCQISQTLHSALRTSMIADRNLLWREIEIKIIKFLQMTKDPYFIRMNQLQLYDYLHLCNIIIEIGLEFSGEKSSNLLKLLKTDLSLAYVEEFGAKLAANFRNLAEKETWDPIYLPYGYKLRELTDPLQDYPRREVFQAHLSQFSSQKSPLQQHFSTFTQSNPFTRVNLISQRDQNPQASSHE